MIIVVLQVAIVLTELPSQYPVHLFIIVVSVSKTKTFMLESKITM